MPEKLGDTPIDEAYRELMNEVARKLDRIFNGEARGRARKTGFILLVYPFGEAQGGRCNYISNGADRKDVAVLFREQAARFEGQPEPEDGHA